MAWPTWAEWQLRGSPRVLKYPYCHQMVTQTHRKGGRRVSGKDEFSKICRCHQTASTKQFRSFRGAHGLGYMGLAATAWVPMGAQVPVLSPNEHPNPSWRRQKRL